MKKLLWLFSAAVLFLAFLIQSPRGASAQEAAEAAIEAAAAGPAGTSAEAAAPPRVLDRGDNAWMLMSSALVLAMTTPGLAMFYGGLVRKKNVVSVLMQCMFLMGLMTVMWGTVGYSLCFGGIEKPDAWIGNSDHFFMKGLQATWTEDKGSEIPLFPLDPINIPWFTHMLFQGMFFIITPALICGAFAERMKFSTMVVFMILWGLLVYCPLVSLGVGRRHLCLWLGTRQDVLCRRGTRFCRRNGRTHQLRRLGPGVRIGPWQTHGLRHRADAAA